MATYCMTFINVCAVTYNLHVRKFFVRQPQAFLKIYSRELWSEKIHHSVDKSLQIRTQKYTLNWLVRDMYERQIIHGNYQHRCVIEVWVSLVYQTTFWNTPV